MDKIYITGFMGTGKSVVAHRLSIDLNVKKYDIDNIVERNAGMKIEQIFEQHGEAHFRELERKAIESIPDEKCIVALGGGAITWGDNLKYLKETGSLVALMATPEEIYKRVKSSKNVRPLLKCDDPYNKIVSLMQKRAYYYIKSDIMIDTNDKTVKEVAETIIKVIEREKENARKRAL